MSGTAICRVLPSPTSAAAVCKYVYRQRRADDDVARAEVVAVGGRFEGGVVTGDAVVDAEALVSRCPAGKKSVGHVVISLEKDEADSEKKLLKAGHSWARRFAPGRGYIVVCHKKDKDCSHTHCHIIFERYGEKGTAVHFSRSDLKEMCAMRFTREFAPVRPDDSPSPTRGASKVYPQAKRLVAREVAELLLRGETWGSLLQKKIITPCRVRDGAVTSFLYKEKRIRVATVERLADAERKRRAEAAAKAKAAQVAALGESSKKMMKTGLGDLIDVVDEIAADTVQPSRGGRGAR